MPTDPPSPLLAEVVAETLAPALPSAQPDSLVAAFDALPLRDFAAAEIECLRLLCDLNRRSPLTDQQILDFGMQRGFSFTRVQAWIDRIHAEIRLAMPETPALSRAKIEVRLERIASAAEARGEFGDAVKAIEAEGRVKGIAIDAKTAPTVAIQFNGPLSADEISAMSDAQLRARLEANRARAARPAAAPPPPAPPARPSLVD